MHATDRLVLLLALTFLAAAAGRVRGACWTAAAVVAMLDAGTGL